MLPWSHKYLDELIKLAELTKDTQFVETVVYSMPFQGYGLIIGDDEKPCTTIADIEKYHPEIPTYYVGLGGYYYNIVTKCVVICAPQNYKDREKIFCYRDIVVPNLKSLPNLLIADSDLIDVDTFSKPQPIILMNEFECSLFIKKKELGQLEKELKDLEDFLQHPWDEYESRKKRAEEKLQKSKAATEYKIKVTKSNAEALKKKVEEKREELVILFKCGE